MGRTVLKYSAVLIAIYLGVAYSTGSGTLINSGTSFATSVVKAFQGRG
jgi:hypothetical protein